MKSGYKERDLFRTKSVLGLTRYWDGNFDLIRLFPCHSVPHFADSFSHVASMAKRLTVVNVEFPPTKSERHYVIDISCFTSALDATPPVTSERSVAHLSPCDHEVAELSVKTPPASKIAKYLPFVA